MLQNVESGIADLRRFENMRLTFDSSHFQTADEYIERVRDLENEHLVWDGCQIFNEAEFSEDEREIRQRFALEKEFMEMRLNP